MCRLKAGDDGAGEDGNEEEADEGRGGVMSLGERRKSGSERR